MKFLLKQYIQILTLNKISLISNFFKFLNIYYVTPEKPKKCRKKWRYFRKTLENKQFIYIDDKSFIFIEWNNYRSRSYYYKYYLYLLSLLKIIFNKFFKFYTKFKFITFVGLGFKKKLERRYKNIFLFFGHRHWITFFIPKKFFIYFIKRKGLIMYSNYKNIISSFMLSFKNFKKESIFKIKGLFDIRSKKKWLFMRRAKIRGLRVKLSKKQKLL